MKDIKKAYNKMRISKIIYYKIKDNKILNYNYLKDIV